MAIFREVFGTSIRFTPAGETFKGDDGQEHPSKPGVSIATTRGEARVSALAVLALAKLIDSDQDVRTALLSAAKVEAESVQEILDQVR